MGKSRTAQLEQPETPYQRAMVRMADKAKAQSTEDEWARKNRRPHPLDAMNTGPIAERYATHERVFWTETPDGKALARPLYPTESDGFLRQLDDAKGEYRVPKRNYLEVKEAADLLGVSHDLILDAIGRGELRAHSPGKFKRILFIELEAYLKSKNYTALHIAEIKEQWEAKLAIVA